MWAQIRGGSLQTKRIAAKISPNPKISRMNPSSRILFEEYLPGAADDLVHHVGVGLGALGVHVGLDWGAVAVEDEHASHRLGRGQLTEALFKLRRHPDQPIRRVSEFAYHEMG